MKTVVETDVLEVITGAKKYNSEKVMLHLKRALDDRAQLAVAMIQAWGMVAARPANEGEPVDGKGLTLTVPAEVVSRACECVDLAFAEFERRGWSVALPKYSELTEIED